MADGTDYADRPATRRELDTAELTKEIFKVRGELEAHRERKETLLLLLRLEHGTG